jgi:hypothetical protein
MSNKTRVITITFQIYLTSGRERINNFVMCILWGSLPLMKT